MKLINKTGHVVVVVTPDGKTTTIPMHGQIRAATSDEQVDTVDGIPIMEVRFTPPYIPEEEGTIYIVSSVIKMMYPDRKDLVVPYKVKYEKGLPKWCYGLIR